MRCAAPTASPCSTCRGRARARARLARPHPAARRRVRAARPRALLAPGPLAHRALRRADRLAGRPQDAGAAPRLPENELRHEPARLPARSVPFRLDAAERAAAGRRDLADDAFQRCRRPAAASPTRCGCSRKPRATCRASARCPTAPPRLRHATVTRVRGDWVRPGVAALRQRPRFPAARHRSLAAAADDDAVDPHPGRPATAAGRHRRLRIELHGRRAAAHRRGGLRLCRWLSAPLHDRHAGAGGRVSGPGWWAGSAWT
jgi:hypothetical protein